MKISIRFINRIFTYNIEPGTRVVDVKYLINDEIGIPLESQNLYVLGPNYSLIELDNNKLLIDYQLDKNSIIELALNPSGTIIIFIRAASAKVIALDIKRIERIENVKFEL